MIRATHNHPGGVTCLPVVMRTLFLLCSIKPGLAEQSLAPHSHECRVDALMGKGGRGGGNRISPMETNANSNAKNKIRQQHTAFINYGNSTLRVCRVQLAKALLGSKLQSILHVTISDEVRCHPSQIQPFLATCLRVATQVKQRAIMRLLGRGKIPRFFNSDLRTYPK